MSKSHRNMNAEYNKKKKTREDRKHVRELLQRAKIKYIEIYGTADF